MLSFDFQNLRFAVSDEGTVSLRQGFGIRYQEKYAARLHLGEVQLAGGNHDADGAQKLIGLSESGSLRYIGHRMENNILTVAQKNDRILHETVFETTETCGTVRIFSRVTNVSGQEELLTAVSAFTLQGFGSTGQDPERELFLHIFESAQHSECRGVRRSFADCGLVNGYSSHRFANVGSWSTKDRFPQGILEDAANRSFLMFQIESNNNWYYEINRAGLCSLNLFGGTERYHGWVKKLTPGECYETPAVALASSDSFRGVLAEMTAYRRARRGVFPADAGQPVIFNEYMHLRWNAPSEEKTAQTLPAVAKSGAKYYVIDCGWHDEAPTLVIYRHVGAWKESKTRFPGGIRATAEKIRSHGMKMGLWIEPEVVGIECTEMLNYYDNDCFLQRNGRRICELGRYLLDFRHPKVRKTLSEVIRRMIEDYGAEYIKFDYNQDCGIGTDLNAESAAVGLEQHSSAYLEWVKELRNQYPEVLFENCSSGGMRADQATLSQFPLMSSSDQTHPEWYPYIVGNLFTAVLPEQAGIWCYPVNLFRSPEQTTGEEHVILNAVNALLGRMQLASDLSRLTPRETELLKEAVRYSAFLAPYRAIATPVLPLGYAKFGDATVSVGLHTGNQLFLAVWKLKDPGAVVLNLSDLHPASVKIGYPKTESQPSLSLSDGILTIDFPTTPMARILELDLSTS